MRLLIDIGNTRIKAALSGPGGLQSLPPLAYVGQDLAALLNSWALPAQLEDCWVASVGHVDVCDHLGAWLRARFAIEAHFPVSQASACGVTNAYDRPANLGVDRWLSVIAAHQMGGAAIVVSAGTAATIDVVDAQGAHLGGLITPGIATQRRAMLDHTQVRASTDESLPSLLGKSTDECVTFGTVHAVAGYIERVVQQFTQGDDPWRLLISGGDAGILRGTLTGSWAYEPDLVFKGLLCLAENT